MELRKEPRLQGDHSQEVPRQGARLRADHSQEAPRQGDRLQTDRSQEVPRQGARLQGDHFQKAPRQGARLLADHSQEVPHQEARLPAVPLLAARRREDRAVPPRDHPAAGLQTALPGFCAICWTSFIWTTWIPETCWFWRCCFSSFARRRTRSCW